MASKTAPHHFKHTLAGFVPMSKAAREFHASTKLGAVVDMRARRPRNPGHHRKMFALLNIVADNCEQFTGPDDVLLAVKAALGHGRWLAVKGASKEIFAPDSIDFASMSQAEFEPFYTGAIQAIRRWWLPVDNAELLAAIEQFEA